MEETAIDNLYILFWRIYTFFFCYQKQQQPPPELLSMGTGHKRFTKYTLIAHISLTFWTFHILILHILPSFYIHFHFNFDKQCLLLHRILFFLVIFMV